MVEKARRLCDADSGHLALPDGDDYRSVSVSAMSPEMKEMIRSLSYAPGRGTAIGRALAERRVVQIADIGADLEHSGRQAATRGFIRTILAVPLLREGEPIGAFGLSRTRVEPFNERQIALVESFAAQAVIAIDNARLLDEIRRRQSELRVTFDNMGDGVAMFDAEHRLAAWNRNFLQILGLPDEFVARRPSVEEYIRYLAGRGEYGSVDIEAEVRRLLGVVTTQWSAERTRPDGRVIELRNTPVPGGGFVLIYSDITERKRAEAEIRTARDLAERALGELKATQQQLVVQQKMAALGQLTAGIAHEIKNPLNFVNNFAALSNELLDEVRDIAAPAFATLDGDVRADLDETMAMLSGNLDKIVEHGRRADNIVKSMLAHSRGSSGERQKSDLNALVEEALNLAYHGARAQDQDFNVTLERAFDTAAQPIELVPQDVMRVFLNLIGNGFHAAHKRRKETADPGFRPVLSVATRDFGDVVEVTVRDNGTGIRPEHRDKLFQPFFTTKPTGEGTGLGLSISYDIVTQQH
ncbi:MAG: PAS-domain containing protein, partial [Stellaceae bacterium]